VSFFFLSEGGRRANPSVERRREGEEGVMQTEIREKRIGAKWG
jgi:hypothetical protein